VSRLITNENFDIHEAVRLIRKAVEPFPKAAMFELQEMGFNTVFHQLVACILSIRTKDETAMPAALELFGLAPTARQIAELEEAKLDAIIGKCAFHEAKAKQIQKIALVAVEKYDGDLPAEFDILTSFDGVGPKCANLALGVAKGHECIAVDTHVHRICNRWGYIATTTPEDSMRALEKTLPREYWIEINALLVPFGKNICTGIGPRCSICPVREMCARMGVTSSR